MLVPVESISILVAAEDSHVSFDVVVEVEEKPNVDIVPFFSQKLNEEKNDHPFLSLMSRIKKFEGRFKENAEKLRRHLTKRNIYMNFTAEKIE